MYIDIFSIDNPALPLKYAHLRDSYNVYYVKFKREDGKMLHDIDKANTHFSLYIISALKGINCYFEIFDIHLSLKSSFVDCFIFEKINDDATSAVFNRLAKLKLESKL